MPSLGLAHHIAEVFTIKDARFIGFSKALACCLVPLLRSITWTLEFAGTLLASVALDLII